MTRVLVLGSTGSIGVQALQVIDAAPDLEAVGLSCGSNAEAMAEQAAPRGIAFTAFTKRLRRLPSIGVTDTYTPR